MKPAVAWPTSKKVVFHPGEIPGHRWNIPQGGRFYSLLDCEETNLSTFCFAPDEEGAHPVNVDADATEVLPSTTQTRTMTVSDVGPITLTACARESDLISPFTDNWNVTEDASYFGVPVDLVVDQSVFTIMELPANEHVATEYAATVTIRDTSFGFTADSDVLPDNHRSYVGCTTVMDTAHTLPIDSTVKQEDAHNFTPEDQGALAVNLNATDGEAPHSEARDSITDSAADEVAPADTETGTITWGDGAVTGALTSDASATLPPTRVRVSAGTFNLAMAITQDDGPADNIADSANSDAIRFGASGSALSGDALASGSRDDILVGGENARSATFNTIFPISPE